MNGEAKPDGYAVVSPDGAFVGIWRERDIAEKIVNRGRSAAGERIEPVYFTLPSYVHGEAT